MEKFKIALAVAYLVAVSVGVGLLMYNFLQLIYQLTN